ncbi:MAG: response regulator [Sterolibacterium sp.]|nr:response regulator [Sterolibacterium sp.]
MDSRSQPFVILLIEDEPADAHLVKVALDENHILTDLHQVVDGHQAFEFLRRQGAQFTSAPRPDLILLDLNMPRMNGREFLATLKKDQALCNIPVVIITTSEAQRDIIETYALGAAGYISKPADMKQFIVAIRYLCDYWIKLVRLPVRS